MVCHRIGNAKTLTYISIEATIGDHAHRTLSNAFYP